MWWWILCVNLTRPWNPSIWSNILDVAVRVFWRIRLIFKSVGSKSGRLPFIIRVSLIQSAAGLNTMKTDLPGERRNSAHWQPMEMKCSISSSLMSSRLPTLTILDLSAFTLRHKISMFTYSQEHFYFFSMVKNILKIKQWVYFSGP